MIKFKDLNVDIGTINPGSTSTVVFEFEGDGEQIVEIRPGCSCTANCKVVGNTIVAEFKESDTKNIKATAYPSGFYPLSKSITVYLKDDEDLQIEGPTGLIYNPNKAKEFLRFTGKVKL